jgi:VWFA-related protein
MEQVIRMKAFSRGWIFLFCFSLSAMAQQATPPVSAGNTESPTAAPARADGQIVLDVVVTDRTGKPISGLQQQDFTLLDNKLEQKVLSFQAVDQTTPGDPTEVILLVDEVNTSFTSVSYERSQIENFLKQNGGKLPQPVSLIFFSDQNTEIQNTASRDGNALLAEFDKSETALRTIRRSAGFYGAEDRLQLSLRTLGSLAEHEASKPGRKLLIWISPGWPILSGPRVELSGRQQQGIFNEVVAMSQALRQARITLSSVDPLGTADSGGLRTTYYQEFLKGLKKANQAQAGNLALQVLATQSGGQVLYSSNDITAEIARCASDAEAYYVLSFDPPRADGPNDYRPIEVKVDKPGLTVRTRTGYYAQP